jgi:hypothetical protein
MVIEAQSPIAELIAKNPVLPAKLVNDMQLALIHPPGNDDRNGRVLSGGGKAYCREYAAMMEPSQIHADPISRQHGVATKNGVSLIG